MLDTRPMPVPDDYERTDSRALRVDEVQAQWLQNAGAGVGAAAAVALLAWGISIDLAEYWRWPLIVGGCVFGIGQVVRAFVDEFRAERRWRRRENEHRIEMSVLVDLCDRLEAERDALRDDFDALRRRNADLERQNASLHYEARKANAPPRRILMEDLVTSEEKRDAHHIVSLWARTGKRPGRRDIVPNDMTRDRWDAAYAQLVAAGLIDGQERSESEMLHALSVRWAEPADYGRDGRAAQPTLEVARPGRPLQSGEGDAFD